MREMTPKQRKKYARGIHTFACESLQVPVPDGKILRIRVELEFVSKIPSTEVVVIDKLSDKLVPSREPFTEEHFSAIFELSLSEKTREFVAFYSAKKNEPRTLGELKTFGFGENHILSVNKKCSAHGLWLAIRPVNPGMIPKRYKFCVLRPKVEISSVGDYRGPWG
jgi:hypothetical protein